MDMKRRRIACTIASKVILLVLAIPAAWAKQGEQQPATEPPSRPPYAVSRATGPIKVDGNLDDAAWQAATVVELAYETRPAENMPPPVKTDVLITHDDDNLYVGFRAQDPDPSAIRAHLSDRDTAFDDDFVGIVLDPFNDERRAFEFFINPLGVQMDMFNDDVGGNEDASWDALWASSGRITDTGYEVEVAIPFSSLRFPRSEGEQTWGFDALRFYPRSQRHRIASQPSDRNVSCYLCQISKMTGFAGVTPGRNVELVPTVTSIRTDTRNGVRGDDRLVEGELETEPGLTAKWGVTPNLTLNGAINPDFSQVEADAAQLDINTTFALYFPEKRPFFLEGADFFTTPLNAVFTRNVADPEWGVKLTGKEGKNGVGVFVAQDDRTNFLIPGSERSSAVSLDMASTDAVLRYRRDLGPSSALGVLLTSREGEGYSNQVAGMDGLYRISDTDAVRAQFLTSQTEYPSAVVGNGGNGQRAGTFDDDAYHVRYTHSARNWNGWAQYEDVGELFRADMGFLPQVDYTLTLGGGDRVWYGPEGAWWTKFLVGAEWDERKDQEGRLLEEESEVWVDLQGPMQSYFSVVAGQRDLAFRGVIFDQTYGRLFVEAQPSGSVYFSTTVDVGDEIDYDNLRAGDLLQVQSSLRYLLGRHLRASLSHVLQQLDVSGGELYEANLSQLTLTYQLNIRTFVRLISQYTDIQRNPILYTFDVDEQSEHLFNQLLFSYKLSPQTVLFAGYSDNSFGAEFRNERIDLARNDRTFFFKIGYAWVP